MGHKRIHPIKPKAYEFNLEEKAIYVGSLYDKYKNQECTIVNKSKMNKKQYYKVQFDDGNIFETTLNVLKKIIE